VSHVSANSATPLAAAAGVMVAQLGCDQIGLNLGCPQRTAYLGHYGTNLLNEPQHVCDMITAAVKEMRQCQDSSKRKSNSCTLACRSFMRDMLGTNQCRSVQRSCPVGSSAHHSRRPLQGTQIGQPSDHSNQWQYKPPCYDCGVIVNGEEQLSTILSRKRCSIMVRPFALTILLIGIFDWSRLGMLYSATAFRPLSISFSVDLLWRGLLLTGSFRPTVARLGRVRCSDHLLGRSSCAVVTEDALLLWQSLLLLQRPMERFILTMKR
jgi:Dihydrouridine synthase (Dus)